MSDNSRADVRTNSKWLDREIWFAEKIAQASGQRLCGLFAGTTDPKTRAHRARELILAHDLAARRVVANRPDTFADCYARLYTEPLSVPTSTPELQQEDFLCSMR